MSDTPREIRGPEDVHPMNLFFEYYQRVPPTILSGEAMEILTKETVQAIPVEEVSQIISLAMDAEAYGGQCGNFEDAHKWRSLSDKLKGAK